MKRLIALVLILLFPSICLSDIGSFNPLPTYATNRPPLKRISKSSIASIVRVKNGRGNALHTVVALASDASPSVNIASGLLSIPLYAYSPVVGAAGQYVLGYGLQALVDIAGKYNDGTLQGNSDLNDLIQDELGPSSSEPITGDVLNPGDLGTTSTACNSQVSLGRLFEIIGPAVHYSGVSRQSSDVICVTNYITYIHSCGYSGNPNLCLADEWPGNWVTGKDSTFPRSLPQYLTPELAEQLAQRISDEITANNQTIKDAIKDLIRDNPDLAPDPQQITNQDIANHTNQEIYDNRQENIDYLTNKYEQAVTNNNTELANYYQDKIQQEQARQDEEQAKEEKEESFSPISDNPFEEPYNPGPYDIPARFTTFLNNVKSTGLFSFSSSFFNSLPGGGSPIYTVEAGTYGTHTIDLSETLSTGLAVLKTVLLLLFGFLSIRVVILKR